MTSFVLVLLAGVGAGMLNAVGGGTFVALPALVGFGLPPVTANAVSRVALVPGSAASAWVYRRDITPVGTSSSRSLTAASLAGGAVGGGLLLLLPASSFDRAAPWLLAFATLVLAVGGHVSDAVDRAFGRHVGVRPRVLLAGQFALGVYGGYFGGAVGILMMAWWRVGAGIDTAKGNPMRVAQVAACYLSATALFLVASDALRAPFVLAAMLVGGVAGGLAGAYVGRRLPAWLLRGLILGTAIAMTVLYFVRG